MNAAAYLHVKCRRPHSALSTNREKLKHPEHTADVNLLLDVSLMADVMLSPGAATWWWLWR